MSTYYTCSFSSNVWDEIISHLMDSVQLQEDYYETQELVHLIDSIGSSIDEDRVKRNAEFKKSIEYEKLFNERDKTIEDYELFLKFNSVVEDYKEGGVLDFLDEYQQFCFVMDLLGVLKDEV